VRDQHPTSPQRGELTSHLLERRRAQDLCGRDAVDVLRPEVALGVQQRLSGAGDHPVRRDVHDRHLDDPLAPRVQPGRLDVHHGVSVHTSTPRAVVTSICPVTAAVISACRRSARRST